MFRHHRDEVRLRLSTENPTEFEILQQQVELLKETLRQEIAAREMLRQRVMQQDGQIRELRRNIYSILQSRIWKTMVRAGGVVLGFDQRLSFCSADCKTRSGRVGRNRS